MKFFLTHCDFEKQRAMGREPGEEVAGGVQEIRGERTGRRSSETLIRNNGKIPTKSFDLIYLTLINILRGLSLKFISNYWKRR